MAAEQILELIGEAQRAVDQLEAQFADPALPRLEAAGQCVETAIDRLRSVGMLLASQDIRGNPEAVRAAIELQRSVVRAGTFLHSAIDFWSGWSRLVGVTAAGYTSGKAMPALTLTSDRHWSA